MGADLALTMTFMHCRGVPCQFSGGSNSENRKKSTFDWLMLNAGLYLSVEDKSCVEDGATYPLQNVGARRLRGFRECPVFVEDGPDDFP